MLSVGITMKLGLELSKIIGKMPLISLSVIMLVFSIYVSHLMPSFLLFMIFNNILYGMFSGLIFLITLSECQKYFP